MKINQLKGIMSDTEEKCIYGPTLSMAIPDCSFAEFAFPWMKSQPEDHIIQVNAETDHSETTRQLLGKSLKVSESLRKLGFGQNDIFSLVARNSSDVYSAVFGVFWLGGVFSPIDFNWKSLELDEIFKKTRPSVVFCEEQYLRNVTIALSNVRINPKIILFADKKKVRKPNIPFEELLDIMVDVDNFKPQPVQSPSTKSIILMPTSGTTGSSKQVEITHRHLLYHLKSFKLRLKEAPLDSFIVTSHFYWITCVISVLASVAGGVKRIYMTNINFTNILNAIDKYKPHTCIISPATLSLLAKEKDIEKYDFSCFRSINLAGSQLTQSLLDNIQRVWKNLPLFNLYGTSETTGSVTVTSKNNNLLSIGRPLSNIKMKIVHPDTRKSLGPYQTGEICVSSPTLMLRYFKNEEETKAVIDGEWYFTGDLGYYDKDGYFYMVDRLKQMIKNPANYQIAPSEIERVIEKIPGVYEAAVVGVNPEPDKFHLVAFVIKDMISKVTEDEIKTFVKENLAEYKQVTQVKFVDMFPRNAAGKLLRKELQKMI